MRRVLLLIGLTALVWGLVAVPSRRVWGNGAALDSGVAALLCVIPAAVTLAWADRALRRPTDAQLVMVLGGTGVRLFATLLGAAALFYGVPALRERDTPGFWFWVGGFYVVTLVLETVLAVVGRQANEGVNG